MINFAEKQNLFFNEKFPIHQKRFYGGDGGSTMVPGARLDDRMLRAR